MKPFILVYFLLLSCTITAQDWNEIQKTLPIPYQKNEGDHYGSSVDLDGDYAVIGAAEYSDKIGCAYVLHFNGTGWDKIAQLTSSDGEYLDYFGCSVSISEDIIVVGAENNENDGAAYVYEKPETGWSSMTETAKLLPSGSSDKFGCAIDIYQDEIIIGAWLETSYSGAAYIFVKPTTGWLDMNETSRLTVSDRHVYDRFGCSVSLYNGTAVIGAYGKDDFGAAYIFEKPESGWSNMNETAKLNASDIAESDDFGFSVNINNDVAIIGSRDNDDNCGAVYLFEKPIGGWENMEESVKLAPSTRTTCHFGWSVYADDDAIIIGTTDNTGDSQAYIFEKPESGWTNMTETTKVKISGENESDIFRSTVCISDDHAIVTSEYSNKLGYNSGAAYFFNKTSTDWTSISEIEVTPSTPYFNNEYDNYGTSVCINENYAVIGAPGYSNGKGCAYVMYNNNNEWKTIATLTASDGVADDELGISVSISNDIICVAAYDDDRMGAVYIFEKTEAGWTDMTETDKLVAWERLSYEYFGMSLDICGNNIIIGADESIYMFEKTSYGWEKRVKRYTSTENNFGHSVALSENYSAISQRVRNDKDNLFGGRVYVYEKTGADWGDSEWIATLYPSNNDDCFNFGCSLKINEDNIIVGASGSSNEAVYIYEKPETGWQNKSETACLTASDGDKYDYFGSSISISNENVIVGAYGDDDNDKFGGAAYIYNKPSTGWTDMTETTKLITSDGGANDRFGKSVFIYGNNAIIGAIYDDENGLKSGSAYIYNIEDATNVTDLNTQLPIYYPNPTCDIVNLELSNQDTKPEKVYVTNTTGRKIISKNVNGLDELEIDLSGYESGIYLIELLYSNHSEVYKVIKK
ncbi:T9SS type A sorting domain-containing protein [Saccharicrinis sp. 156]|uniref:T9SS type A sorting domain-containing protein n=1 Tax=Saccharicrinis sp. 156 TaxID=3417574 RepID=UPI003D35365E